MLILKGKPASGGIEFGKIVVYKNKTKAIKRVHINDINAELERFHSARRTAISQLDMLYRKTLSEIGETDAMIFYIHQIMLDDKDFIAYVEEIIKTQRINSESAVYVTSQHFYETFAAMDDAYMKARSADIRDVSDRVISVLQNEPRKALRLDEASIILADDLSPSETVTLDKTKTLAFVCEKGATTSHTAILARTMNIPAVLGIKSLVRDEYNGLEAIIDGFSGTLYINPDEETRAVMRKKRSEHKMHITRLKKLIGEPAVTCDGKRVILCANIDSQSELEAAKANDCEEIGLFRSEVAYLSAKDYPTEDELFELYRKILLEMSPRPVTIRTLDIGADKKVDYFGLPEEENPAMGLRAIRLCLKREELFKIQLRALLRASVFGKLSIMFPMISTVEELRRAKDVLEECRGELIGEGIPVSDGIKVGIMIETPAAAITADKLAKEADFFSIGTNDLTQYIMAADRQNEGVSELCSARSVAVLRIIAHVAEAAHKENITVSICGEAAADLDLTESFIAYGIDKLSVAPATILELKERILKTDVSRIKQTALDRIK